MYVIVGGLFAYFCRVGNNPWADDNNRQYGTTQ